MSIEKNKVAVRSFIEELGPELTAIDSFCTDDFVAHLPGSPQPANREGFKQFASMLYKAFPDLNHRLDSLFAETDMVVSRVTIQGTHLGELFGISPSGKSVEFTDIIIIRLDNGKAVQLWAQFDFLGLLQQLGVNPFG